MIDVTDVLKTLAEQRPVYHSEADFQHAFAWEVHRRLPEAFVRLERPIHANGKILHLDFLVRVPGKEMAIELKYKTRKLSIVVANEEFHLKDHNAQDQGRYEFIKDICRLEEIVSARADCEGWAVLLTNDSAYWKPSLRDTVDGAFRVHEGGVLHGTLGWTDSASDGTKGKRLADLEVTGRYALRWSDYVIAQNSSCGRFRYLAVQVANRV